MRLGLGATQGATKTNDLAILRTHADSRHGLTRGHELIRTVANACTGTYGLEGCRAGSTE